MTVIDDHDELAGTPGRDLALACIEAGIRAAEPTAVVERALALESSVLVVDGARYDLDQYERVILAGGGNAGATVAAAVEALLGDRIDGGVVVTDNPVEIERVAVHPSDHPIPSERGVESAKTLIETVTDAGPDDLVLGIITGGGSALMPAPAEGIDLADLRSATQALLSSGATIAELNAVRKHCSALKGGQLARAAAPATVVALVFSDVVGDPLDVIASGPLAPDPTTYEDALTVLERYGLDDPAAGGVPAAVIDRLRAGANGENDETPSAGADVFDRVTHHVLANGATALEGAAATAHERGYDALLLGDRIRGESREAAKTIVGIAESCLENGTPAEPPVVLLSGGETTVTVRGDGTGGPNQEFALAAALELSADGLTVATADTDGIDGTSDAAGGIVDADTVRPSVGDDWEELVDADATYDPTTRDAGRALADNDAGTFLDEYDGLIVTGPTETNVNDLRAIVVGTR